MKNNTPQANKTRKPSYLSKEEKKDTMLITYTERELAVLSAPTYIILRTPISIGRKIWASSIPSVFPTYSLLLAPMAHLCRATGYLCLQAARQHHPQMGTQGKKRQSYLLYQATIKSQYILKISMSWPTSCDSIAHSPDKKHSQKH